MKISKLDFNNCLTQYLVNFSLPIDKAYLLLIYQKVIVEKSIDTVVFQKAIESLYSLDREQYFQKYSNLKLSVADWLNLCDNFKSKKKVDHRASLNKKAITFFNSMENLPTKEQAQEFYNQLDKNEQFELKYSGLRIKDLWSIAKKRINNA